jgi:hypothetical protein
MAGFASLSDVKAHLNITSTDNDDELQLMLDAASETVRSLVGSITDDVAEVLPVHNGTIILSRRNVTDVLLHPDEPVSGFTVNHEAGLVYGVPLIGRVSVTYSVGDGARPASLTLATLIIAAHLWETQRGAAPSGPLAADDDTGIVPGLGYAIPNRARELLEPFIRASSQIA